MYWTFALHFKSRAGATEDIRKATVYLRIWKEEGNEHRDRMPRAHSDPLRFHTQIVVSACTNLVMRLKRV